MSMQSRLQWEEKERRIFAPYAQFSSLSRGREHPEAVHVFRSEFQRDRDRIVHSQAFRRLECKTQVVLNGAGDRFRTRMTHTIEVEAISRTIARTLSLNEDLAAAIALAHDLGHPPFGHPGEHTLDELMRGHGGFEHNQQSLRIVEHLEVKYPEFNGLNLSWEVREGLKKHEVGCGDFLQPSLEAQVADVADEVAYCCHDLDDALDNGLIEPEALSEVILWRELNERIGQSYSRLDFERRRCYLIRCLVEDLVEDVCRQSSAWLAEEKPADADAVRRKSRRLVGFSLEMRAKVQNLRDFLLQHFYYHESVSRVNQRACRVLQALFQFYMKHPHLVGDKLALRLKKEDGARVVCDYVSGMTDGYALKMYERHIGTDRLLEELRRVS